MTDRPRRKANLTEDEMDEDLLIVDFRGSQIHVLNPAAAAIWELCDGQYTVEQIAALMAGHLGLPNERVQQDVAKVVDEFREKGLVE